MKAQIENTSKIVDLVTPNGTIPARIWEGVTENGIRFHCYITRVAVEKNEDAGEFEKALQEVKEPSAEINALPLRLVL